jgi:hypothetical protein
MAAAYEDVRQAGAELIGDALEDLDVGASEARALCSVLIALCDGLILQWLLEPEAVPGAADVTAALELLAEGSAREVGSR